MEFNKTNFDFFYKHCISKFGEDIGNMIYETAENILAKMKSEVDYKNSKAIKWHMDKNMLPTIAMYFAFKKFDVTCERAYEYTGEILKIACEKVQNKNKFLGKMPFGYKLFKVTCKSLIEKQYPQEGWDIEWIKYDNKEIHVDFKTCIYMETTKKYNCSELCPLFCSNDDITLGGFAPNIIFERNGTIGRGQDKCDFYFINGKSESEKISNEDKKRLEI
ncbi:L-2-amino-thiazoline-4-carboxylic acid hydrolase [Clostridium cavendishii DSM 21758]|uniref:L-2-amino-thiazoline-4-carboxylic acid hydrolase n=1 Tax=Clostridium cavendishii DSM 21758 TaxID=1121302 RepID=A0A1M6CA79_9CLOT|nr:L-2-amino-thiazoline-4-carboxylic acid hydrolase [Clostridium cavendishii]SHI57935.1 L-2-amino-thiazoline-4-carboxylic acid hydrolase [Clostridium cavendishii DSM 21758]